MAKNANHFLAATLSTAAIAAAKTSKPNVEKYFWKAVYPKKLSQSFTMSSALGMNLMPPTSAFQHGLQQAVAASQQPQNQQSSETNDEGPQPQDALNGKSAVAEHAAKIHAAAAAAAAAAASSSGEFSFNQSKSHIKVSYFY